jgi:hypothetical protein
MAGYAQDVQIAVPTSSAIKTWILRSVTAESTWRKSTANVVVAWAPWNCRELVSGGIRAPVGSRSV